MTSLKLPIRKKQDDIKIYFSDDSKIKSFGEILTSDAGREILKLLLINSYTANQIAQNTGISLQLVKYHITKMQDLGIISVSKIEKNSKSHDMKYYVAEKFAIMILPQTELDKIKHGIMETIRDASKITAIGISAISAWVLTQIIQPSSQNPMMESIKARLSYSGTTSLPGTIDESLDLARAKVDLANSAALGSGTPIFTQELFLIQIIGIGVIMASLAGILFYKAKKHRLSLAQ